jgi:hypothetical protein
VTARVGREEGKKVKNNNNLKPIKRATSLGIEFPIG